jgi:hypothetical protein
MKLYTEEDLRECCSLIFNALGVGDDITTDEVLAGLTPIELPTDEEIKEMRKAYLEEVNDIVHADLERDGYLDLGFHVGAKWMRDKIQGGEQ